MIKFPKLAEYKNYTAINEMLKNGFNPNCRVEFVGYYSYDNGAITGSSIVTTKILDNFDDDPAIVKLLRHYGAKTSNEDYEAKIRQSHKQRQAKLEKDLAFIDGLINS